MSSTSSTLTDAHFQYIAERTSREDPFLLDLKQAARAVGIPEIWIAPEQASFIQILLKLTRARNVVEVGTLAGYSAICMARALPEGGRVRTIEIDGAHADFAQAWIARSDAAGKVEVIRGTGRRILPRFADRSADAAFVDADKGSYPLYLKECLRIVRPGGLIMVDNALAFGQLLDEEPMDPDVPAVREFNDLMAGTAGLHGIIVPIGDGLWVAFRTP